jgi:hypothetical protein
VIVAGNEKKVGGDSSPYAQRPRQRYESEGISTPTNKLLCAIGNVFMKILPFAYARI